MYSDICVSMSQKILLSSLSGWRAVIVIRIDGFINPEAAAASSETSVTLYHCIVVVGSRWLMPPDALQLKVYCTNPGL